MRFRRLREGSRKHEVIWMWLPRGDYFFATIITAPSASFFDAVPAFVQ